MNPSNTEDESATTQPPAQSSSNEERNSCYQCTQDYFLKITTNTKLFVCLIIIFLIAFFFMKEVILLGLFTAGFIIILGIYMANQRNRIERLRLLQGMTQSDTQHETGYPSEVPIENVYVVPITLPIDRSRSRTNSSQPLISPSSPLHKPADDEPPRYEDVMSAAPPPSYESLSASNLRS